MFCDANAFLNICLIVIFSLMSVLNLHQPVFESLLSQDPSDLQVIQMLKKHFLLY